MIINHMRHLVPILMMAVLPAWGGTVNLSLNEHATQNLFQTSDAVADRISTFSLALDHDFSAISFLAKAEYTAFDQTPGMSFFAADLGLDYLVTAGTKSAFYFAAGGAGEFYGQSYEAFSSLGANLLGAFKTYLAPSSILKLQWQVQYAVYKDRLFDFLSQTASLSIDKYFTTRTTLKADAEYGYKYFLHPFLPEPSEPTTSTTLMSGGGRGGRQYQGGYGFIPRYGDAGGGAGIGHVSASLLAAQGIGDIVGLSASAVRQWIVSGENPFLSIEEFYFVQNPSSDSFSWDGYQLTGRITLNLPWDVALKTGYAYSDKTYPGVESMSLDGAPLGVVRNDLRHILDARLQKDFRRFSVFLAYSYVDNTSTDPLFIWKSNSIMGGVEWNLPTRRKEGV